MSFHHVAKTFLNFRNMTVDFCVNRLSMHLFLYNSDSKRRILIGGQTSKYSLRSNYNDNSSWYHQQQDGWLHNKKFTFAEMHIFKHEQLCLFIKAQIFAGYGQVALI